MRSALFLGATLISVVAIAADNLEVARQQEAKISFIAKDLNKSGFIEKSEQYADCLKQLDDEFKKFDEADEGLKPIFADQFRRELPQGEFESTGESRELLRKKLANERVRRIFLALDLNRDKKISFEEFLKSYSLPPI